MIQQLLTMLIGILGGIAVGIQSPIGNAIGKRIGAASSSFVAHLSGAAFSAIVLLMQRGENIHEIRSVPWWMFGIGLFGIILFLTINYTIPRIGASAAIALIVVGQMAAGMVIDHFGLLDVTSRPIDGTRILALLLLLGGGYLMAK